MKYKIAELNIDCNEDLRQIACDLLADALGEIGFEAFENSNYGLKAYIQDHLFHFQQLDVILQNFVLENVKLSYNIEEAEDKNWNEAWENAGFAPINIEDKIIIYDAKSEFTALSADMMPIKIEAQQAFGTGTHETTRMMIQSMMRTDLRNKRVLDCGCGTGILSIAANKLGAASCVAYDIDQWSVENTRHNMKINNIENIEVLQGDANVLSHVSGLFDVLLANINRNILLSDMKLFKEMMNSEGLLIISGFFVADANMLIDKANQLGMQETHRTTDGDWCCLTFRL